MITGFNTDVEYDGIIYHVQTEDKGLDSPLILSLVYVGGAILASKRSPYDDLIASGFNDTTLSERLQRQHQLICAAIHAGRIEDLKRMGKREPEGRAAQPASQTEPQAPATPDQASIARKAVADIPAPPATLPPAVPPPPAAIPPTPVISPVLPPPIMPGAGHAAAFNAVDGDVLHLSFLEERELRAGQFVTLRIRVSRGAGEDRDSVPDAPVTVKILGTTFRTLVSSARTDRDGIALVFAALPRFTSGRAAILVHTAIGGLTAEMRRIIQNAWNPVYVLKDGLEQLRIQVNDETRELSDRATLSDLIRQLALAPERLAVELNREVVRRADWPQTILAEGDRVEIVHFVGGGEHMTGDKWCVAGDELRRKF